MFARDVMTMNVVSVTPDTPVQEIAKTLLDHRISAVPVIDASKNVAGIVSEGDLMRRPPNLKRTGIQRGGSVCSRPRRSKPPSSLRATGVRPAMS